MRWVQVLLRPVSAGGLLGALTLGLLGFAPIPEERERLEPTEISIEITSFELVDDDDGEVQVSGESTSVTFDVGFHRSGAVPAIGVDVRSRGPPLPAHFV